MSEATKTKLQEALEDHFRDVLEGSLLTGWQIVLCGVSPKPEHSQATAYWYDNQDGQSIHVTLGLAEMGRKNLDRAYDEDEEDDDE